MAIATKPYLSTPNLIINISRISVMARRPPFQLSVISYQLSVISYQLSVPLQ
ncbi:hypothetical protein [Okeania sp. SIO3I5]|uniref:hypothetical protein n=1 Tax=Okeania sp. SIO3I5 TaxID=2607805 RepID=UPI0025F1D2AF|nr:hypothetical protein [Okeania sp. SIO3I5]